MSTRESGYDRVEHEHTRQPWSEMDLARLRELCGSNLSYGEIATAMGRSMAAIQGKAGRLGISSGLALGGRKGAGNRVTSHVGDRAMEIGEAAELLVCVDLLLAGFKAFQSSQGLPYDVVAQIDDRLVRIAVKANQRPRARPEREGGRVCYQFGLTRSSTNKYRPSARYTLTDCDLVALVAIDIRSVIYVPPKSGWWPTGFHVDPPMSDYSGRSRNGLSRKTWEAFPLSAALAHLRGGFNGTA